MCSCDYSITCTVFSVFTSHVIKTKNRNHSVNKVKNLGCDRWLKYKQPRKESGLCCFSFACYLQKCVTQISRALYADTMFVPFGGHKHMDGGSKVTETSVTEFCYWNVKIIALSIRNIKINASSSASTVKLTKTKAITLLLTSETAFLGRHFHVMQRNTIRKTLSS